MTEEHRIILISDFIEQKVRKEKELDFYLRELEQLQSKIFYLRKEVDLTNLIIDMIKSEEVHDVQERLYSKFDNQLIKDKK